MKTKEPTICGLTKLDVMRYARETAEEHIQFTPEAFKPMTEEQAKRIKAALVYYAEVGAREAFNAMLRNS